MLVHPLLGERVALPTPQWEGPLESARVPRLRDHVVGGATVLSGSAYVELAFSAAGTGRPQVRDLVVSTALTCPADDSDPTQLRVATVLDGEVVTVSSRRGAPTGAREGSWQQL
ncbi:hotdog family protein [Streptomyces sp. YIM S03343]